MTQPAAGRFDLSPLSALILGFFILLAASVLSYGLAHFRAADRTVTVKGLATQEVEADLVIWPLKHTATGNVLTEAQAALQANAGKIEQFLKAQGLEDADIVARKIEVTDLLAQAYRPENASDSRFIIAQTFTVRTDKVATVESAAQNIGDLLAQNVTLQNDNYASSPSFIYTKLNDIKPGMIARATANARESAQQFAIDSGAEVGDIKDANQGVFEILGRDSENAYDEKRERFKTVRVVSTLRFKLD